MASDKVRKTQELRRSNASQPHVTKVRSDREIILEEMEQESG